MTVLIEASHAGERRSGTAVLGLVLALAISAVAAHVVSTAADDALPPCASARIAINSATAKELAQLSGIGLRKAEAIVRYRESHGPFTALDELRAVRGISQRLLDVNRKQLQLD